MKPLCLDHPEKFKSKDYVAVSQWFLEEFDKNLKVGGDLINYL